MGIKWNSISEQEKRKFEKMNELEKFIYFLLKQFGSPYGWGKENPDTSDCSGAVCMSLFAATGLLIRTTADDLYKRVFTVINPRANQIRVIFCISKKNVQHGDRTVPAGTVTVSIPTHLIFVIVVFAVTSPRTGTLKAIYIQESSSTVPEVMFAGICKVPDLSS